MRGLTQGHVTRFAFVASWMENPSAVDQGLFLSDLFICRMSDLIEDDFIMIYALQPSQTVTPGMSLDSARVRNEDENE